MKKFFAWALVLAMVMTMMPVMDVHNHAHAATSGEGYGCDRYSCDCTLYVYGKTTMLGDYCTCGHKASSHTVAPEEQCNHVAKEDDGDCTTRVWCKICETHIMVDKKDEHVPGEDDGNCTTPILCSNPGCTQIAAEGFPHTRKSDGDCTTADDCSVCEQKAVFPAGVHTPGEDDGDCTTPVQCADCPQIAVAAKEHIAAEDDGDCTTAVLCANAGCEVVMTAAKASHTPKADDGDCTTAVYCADCDKVAIPAAASHTPMADDGDCSTPIECSVCHKVTTEAASTHNLVNGACTDCEFVCKHTATTKTTTKEANCKEEGTVVETCDACGVVVDTETLPVDSKNHNYVVFPFGAGYCVRCNEVNVNYDDFEDMLPEDKPVENPCDEHQWAHLEFGAWYCTKCGASATDIKPLEPEVCDHADTYIEVVEAATCKKEGTAKEVCDICEEVLDENVVLPIDKENGHDLVIFPFGASWCNICSEINVNWEDFVEPENPQDTCDHNWHKVTHNGYFCDKCQKITTDENEVNAPKEEPEGPKYCENNEHEWATLGFGAWYCLKCGANSTNIFPLEPEYCDHAGFYIDVTTPATCVATGLGNKVCDLCETVLEEGVEVPVDPDAHKWVVGEGGIACCELCGLLESELPEEEPCDHMWLQVATGWFCGKCGAVTLDDPFATEPVVLLGDVNDDGVVDGRDEVRLMKYLVGQGVSINKANADLNGDGVIDGRDEIRLLYKLL